MNYKNETLRQIMAFGAENPEYTLTDLLYSVLQPVAIANNKPSLNWLRNISDEQMFTFVEKAREIEMETQPIVSEVEIITILRLQ